MAQSCASAFITWANPREIIEYEHDIHGDVVLNEDGSKKVLSSTPSFLAALTEQEICDLVLKMWCDSKPGRIGAVTYCVSDTGFHHLHMVLEVENANSDRFTYASVQKLYGKKFHIEPTRGSKKEAEDYIYKRGKWTEKGEQVLAMALHGDIKGNQGNRSDLQGVEDMINDGMTPNEILDTSVKLRRYEKIIKDAYYRKRYKETPFVRDLEVIWHIGLSESGKSYSANELVEQYGEENIYFVSDYQNGWIDKYNGESILFLDELKEQLSYSMLKVLTDKYKAQVHGRYTNVYALWSTLHITSIYPPEELYELLVPFSERRRDTFYQLQRRIAKVVYHWRDKTGQFRQYEQDMKEYRNFGTLKNLAEGKIAPAGNGFLTVTPEEEKYIQETFM